MRVVWQLVSLRNPSLRVGMFTARLKSRRCQNGSCRESYRSRANNQQFRLLRSSEGSFLNGKTSTNRARVGGCEENLLRILASEDNRLVPDAKSNVAWSHSICRTSF